METSAGILLISMRPFAAAKWSTWLVSKQSPRLSGSLPSYTKSATYLTAPLPSSPYREHTKTTWVTKTLCSQYCTKTKQTCRNACTLSSGECNWWPVSHHESLDNTHQHVSTVTVINQDFYEMIIARFSPGVERLGRDATTHLRLMSKKTGVKPPQKSKPH